MITINIDIPDKVYNEILPLLRPNETILRYTKSGLTIKSHIKSSTFKNPDEVQNYNFVDLILTNENLYFVVNKLMSKNKITLPIYNISTIQFKLTTIQLLLKNGYVYEIYGIPDVNSFVSDLNNCIYVCQSKTQQPYQAPISNQYNQTNNTNDYNYKNYNYNHNNEKRNITINPKKPLSKSAKIALISTCVIIFFGIVSNWGNGNDSSIKNNTNNVQSQETTDVFVERDMDKLINSLEDTFEFIDNPVIKDVPSKVTKPDFFTIALLGNNEDNNINKLNVSLVNVPVIDDKNEDGNKDVYDNEKIIYVISKLFPNISLEEISNEYISIIVKAIESEESTEESYKSKMFGIDVETSYFKDTNTFMMSFKFV